MKPRKAARLLCVVGLLSIAQLTAAAQLALRGLPPLDSLQTQLRRPNLPDTTRVIMLGQLASIHELTDPALALRDGQQGLKVARRAGFRFSEVQFPSYPRRESGRLRACRFFVATSLMQRLAKHLAWGNTSNGADVGGG